MLKTFLISTVIVLSAGLVSGQSGYQIDNFDLPNAVQIHTPKVEPRAQPKSLLRLTSMPLNPSLSGFTTGNSEVDSFIVESGKRNSVDPLLLYSIMHQESSFKQRAMSHKGARGLMQLMPPTAARFGVRNIWDPKQNIEGGARYMRFLLDLFEGDVRLALAGYNAGEGAVMKYGYKVPPYNETQEYVRRISKRYSLIRDPDAAATANRVTSEQLASRQKDSAPLTVYEPTVSMVRLPDGRLQLLSQ